VESGIILWLVLQHGAPENGMLYRVVCKKLGHKVS